MKSCSSWMKASLNSSSLRIALALAARTAYSRNLSSAISIQQEEGCFLIVILSETFQGLGRDFDVHRSNLDFPDLCGCRHCLKRRSQPPGFIDEGLARLGLSCSRNRFLGRIGGLGQGFACGGPKTGLYCPSLTKRLQGPLDFLHEPLAAVTGAKAAARARTNDRRFARIISQAAELAQEDAPPAAMRYCWNGAPAKGGADYSHAGSTVMIGSAAASVVKVAVHDAVESSSLVTVMVPAATETLLRLNRRACRTVLTDGEPESVPVLMSRSSKASATDVRSPEVKAYPVLSLFVPTVTESPRIVALT